MTILSSKDNSNIKNAVKLRKSAKYRRESGRFIAEGVRICMDAMLSTNKAIPSKPNNSNLLKEFKNSPKQKMRKERTTILLKTKKSNCFVGIANGIAVPIIKIKNGKTKSVGVQPCHSACAKGG